MDFNIYDFLGNPPRPKNNLRYCPHCLERTTYNRDWDLCEICGKGDNECQNAFGVENQ